MQRLWVRIVAVLAAGVVAVAVWRPWHRPTQSVPGLPVAGTSLIITKAGGGPCEVRITGTSGTAVNSMSAHLAAGPARSGPLAVPSLYTVDTVTVTRDGQSNRHELKVALRADQPYELRIAADDSVELVPAP